MSLALAAPSPPLSGLLSPARLALAALLLGTVLGALASVGLVRPLFVLGAAGVGYLAWREGASRSVEVAVVLFSIAPFLRRLADLGLGFEPSGYMLLGPLLAILIPAWDLRHLLTTRQPGGSDLAPILLAAICLAYGALLSGFGGALLPVAAAAIKAFAPLLYGVWIWRQARQDRGIIEAAARAFLLVTPLMGLYGLWQYVSPPAWDRYWMFQAQMDSIGAPEPYQVRVFSTMNSPASFAVWCACGLLVLGFCRSGWQAALAALPVAFGLLLSMSRTHWIGLVVGVLYCALFARTRGRALLLMLLLGLAILAAAFSSPDIADAILNRLGTLGGSVAQDGSGAARLDQFSVIYAWLDDLILGRGLAESGSSLRAGTVLDGELAGAWVRMGLVFGTLYLFGLVWAVALALSRISARSLPQRVVAGAVLAGALAQMPLVGVAAAEAGFLFWLFLGVALATPPAPPETSAHA